MVAKNNFSTNAKQGIGAQGGQGGPGGPGHVPPGFDAAAKTLGVSQDALMRAITKNGGRQLDTVAAAKDLKVTEAALKAALPRLPGL